MQEYVNGQVLINGKLIQKDFLVKDGKIFFDYEKTSNPIDISHLVVSPGFVDIHVHTRTPGYTHKEDLNTVTESALAGGFTTIVAMANINPSPVDVESFKHVQNIIKDSKINIIQAARVTNDGKLVNVKELSKYTKIFSDDGLPINDSSVMAEALKAMKENDCLISLHEEDHNIKGVGYTSEFTKSNNLPTFGSEYEYNITSRDVELNRGVNAKMHFQHISTKETIELVKKARKENILVTAEITPHHLYFSNEDINGSTNFKMNPPLNSKEDRDVLRNAFLDGTVKVIATDHAPHSNEEKGDDWNKSYNGIIGLQTAFSAVYSVFGKDHIEKILMGLSVEPAKLIGMDVELKDGQDANLVFIDINKEWTYTKENNKSKSENSPWMGMTLKGKVEQVICNKKI